MDDHGSRRLSVSSAVLHPPADLLTVVGHTILTLGVVLHPVFRDTPLRVVVGLPFVLFVPGYVLVATLFPEANRNKDQAEDSPKTGLSGIGRVALSFGLSMVVVPLVGFVLNYTPFGLRLTPMLVSLTGVVLLLTVTATLRRQALPQIDRFVVPWRLWLTGLWTEFMEPDSWPDATMNVLLVASIILSVGSVGYAVAASNPGKSTTEFYLLTETDGGELTDEYPTTLVAGEPQSFVIGVDNQGDRPIDYTVVVKLDQVQIQNNSTQVVRTERLQNFEQRLEGNETWQHEHTVTPQLTGDQLRLTYLLYRGDPPTNPTTESAHRELQLWINVTT